MCLFVLLCIASLLWLKDGMTSRDRDGADAFGAIFESAKSTGLYVFLRVDKSFEVLVFNADKFDQCGYTFMRSNNVFFHF